MSLRVAGEAAEEVVVRRGRCRVRVKAADLVGAEVARAAWSRVVARGAGFGVAERDEQRQPFESGHGFAQRGPSAGCCLVSVAQRVVR